MNSYDIIEVKKYFADTAQILASKRQRQSIKRSILPKLPKTLLTELCEAMKQTYRIHSIDTFIHYYKTEHNDCIIPCTKTIYNWIHHGILSLKPIDLPRMVRLRKPSKPRNNTHKKILGTSIEERPEHINTRETFGHWEIDLIIGKQSKEEPVMLTLIERQTRYLIIKKLKHKTAQNSTKQHNA